MREQHGRSDRDVVELAPPDLSALAPGNTGVPYVWRFASRVAGPHVAVTALMHGNEIAGAVALARLFGAGIRPARGKLTLAFANVTAFERFDPARPRESRFVDEDMNRVWSSERLANPISLERGRAAALAPLLSEADFLLDLHTMQTASPALLLSTLREKGRRLSAEIGTPAWVVADAGHANGPRLIDFGPFGDPLNPQAAILLEAGQHWRAGSVETAWRTVVRLLDITGILDREASDDLTMDALPGAQRFVEVTEAVTARSDRFRFERAFKGLEIISAAGTTIASDGGEQRIATPYPDCVLVMPIRRIKVGLTAVRLGRLVPAPALGPPGAAGR